MEAGKVVKVGLQGLNNPTPMWMKYVTRTILYLSMVWAFLAPTFTELDEHTLNTINLWLLRANGILNITTKFFGWADPNESNN